MINMSFKGFTPADFDTFKIEGLENRMEAIRKRIQPKFKQIGEALLTDISLLTGDEMFLHIAKHARRSVNPPKDTWLAFSNNKRGYKQHPHFQIGLFDDHVFLWFALIYELPNKRAIAEKYLKNITTVSKIIPKDYVLSFDHTKKESVLSGSLDKKRLQIELERFRNVKKTELLVGRHIQANDPILRNGEDFIDMARETLNTLIPLYKLAAE
jgi:uncharacterized protein YktB (UPF0637 family)